MLEDPYEYTPDRPRLIIPAILWFLSIVFAIGVVLLMVGCAPAEIQAQVCYLRFMGKTEEGYTVVTQACMSPEQFAEGQK